MKRTAVATHVVALIALLSTVVTLLYSATSTVNQRMIPRAIASAVLFAFLLSVVACGSDSPLAPSSPPPPSTPPAPSAPADPCAGRTGFCKSGEGLTTFELPAGITQVRITATATESSCRQFLVYVAQRMVVSAILGTCPFASSRTYDNTHAILGPRIDIRGSNENDPGQPIRWMIEEAR